MEGQAVPRRSPGPPQALRAGGAEALRHLYAPSSGHDAVARSIALAGTIALELPAQARNPGADRFQALARCHAQAALRDPPDHRRRGPGDPAPVLASQRPPPTSATALEISPGR